MGLVAHHPARRQSANQLAAGSTGLGGARRGSEGLARAINQRPGAVDESGLGRLGWAHYRHQPPRVAARRRHQVASPRLHLSPRVKPPSSLAALWGRPRVAGGAIVGLGSAGEPLGASSIWRAASGARWARESGEDPAGPGRLATAHLLATSQPLVRGFERAARCKCRRTGRPGGVCAPIQLRFIDLLPADANARAPSRAELG